MAVIQDNDKYVATLQQGQIKPYYRIELLDRANESFIEDITSYLRNGSISATLQQGVRRTCSLTFTNSDGFLNPRPDFLWYASKIRLILGAEDLQSDDRFEFVQGIFCVAKIAMNSEIPDRTISLDCTDKFALLNGTLGGQLKDIELVESGQNIASYIRSTLDQTNSTGEKIDSITPLIDGSFENTTTPYDIRREQNSNLGDVYIELAKINSADIFYAPAGNLSYLQDFNDEEKTPLFTFVKGDRYTQVVNRQFPLADIINSVTIVGDNTLDDAVVGNAVDDNPESNTNIKIVPEKNERRTESVYQTNASAEKYAFYLLNQFIRKQSSIDISTPIPILHLAEDEIIQITNSDIDADRINAVINNYVINFGSATDWSTTINATEISQLS